MALTSARDAGPTSISAGAGSCWMLRWHLLGPNVLHPAR